MLELRELSAIVDGEGRSRGLDGAPPTKEEMQTALQVLMVHQCIYPSTQRIGRTYEIVKTHSGYFQKVLDAMGRGLKIDSTSQMIAVTVDPSESRYDWHYSKLKRDETMVLLALRLAYEEGMQESRMNERGAVEVTSDDVVDKLQAIFHDFAIAEKRLYEILDFFKRKGFIRPGPLDRQEHARVIEIMPGIDIATPDGYLDHLTAWAENEAARQAGSGQAGSGRTGGRRAAAGSGDVAASDPEDEEPDFAPGEDDEETPAGQASRPGEEGA